MSKFSKEEMIGVGKPTDKSIEKPANAETGRRDFLKAAVTTGALGAAAMAPAIANAASPAPQQTDVQDPQLPTLRPPAEIDYRFPVSYKSSVPESTRVVLQYFEALSARNLSGMADMMHFPFVTYEGIKATLVETPDQLMQNPPPSMTVVSNGENILRAGAYDLMDTIQVHVYSVVGAGLIMEYSRFDTEGHLLVKCSGIYGVTNNDGKWGIEYMSTIFTPANQVGLDDRYNFAAVDAALHSNWRDHHHGRTYGDTEVLRASVAVPIAHGTVNLTPNRVKGIKSRLRFSTGDTPEYMAKQNYNQENFAVTSGESVGKWAYSIEHPQTRVLHASTDKGHYFTGYNRYMADGTIISEHRFIGTLIYWRGVWYGNDIGTPFGHVMYHDRTNDIHS